MSEGAEHGTGRPDLRESRLHRTAEACAAVVRAWQGQEIDIERDGLRLIAEFAGALGLKPRLDIEPKTQEA